MSPFLMFSDAVVGKVVLVRLLEGQDTVKSNPDERQDRGRGKEMFLNFKDNNTRGKAGSGVIK
jgi:hypothetical protein